MHHENFGVKFSPLMKKITSNAWTKFQKNVKDVIKIFNAIIEKDNTNKYIQIEPQAPKSNITVKLRK
jgi:hypothetical protein